MKLDLPFFSSSLDDDDNSSSNNMPVPTNNNNNSSNMNNISSNNPRPQLRRPTAVASPIRASPAAATTPTTASPIKKVSTSECAYLLVKSSTAEDLETADELYSALVMAGYNPTQQLMNRYWKEDNKAISFKDFDHIVQTEPKPRKIDLLSCFRRLDPQGTGSIPHQTFLEVLVNKGGDSPISPQLAQKYINNPTFNKNKGFFDYATFCECCFETSKALDIAALDLQNKRLKEQEINTKTYKVNKNNNSTPIKKNKSMRGAFYFEGDSIIGHQYTLRVNQRAKFKIDCNVSGNGGGVEVDSRVFVFKLSGDANSRVGESSNSVFVARSGLKMPGQEGPSWVGYLDVGTYLLVPSTTGCLLKKRKKQPESSIQLVSKGASSVALTDNFSKVLTSIYNQVDLDKSGTLSRTEFNLFNWRTSGEEVQDEEWEVVKDNFSLENGELSMEGFMQLHQMEAEDNGGDSAELWITLNAMGYNSLLKQDEASIFELLVGSSVDSYSLDVCGLKAGGTLLDRASIRCILQSAKEEEQQNNAGTVVKKLKEGQVVLYAEETNSCSSWIVQNRSSEHVSLNLDFSASSNALINHPHMIFRTSLSPKTTVFVAHLIPADPSERMKVNLKESLAK